jgi:phytoene dehydrogenase-like protein
LNHKNVTAIEHDDKVHGILFADGEKLEVPSVVITMGPEDACKLVKESASSSLRQWADRIQPIKAVCLDLGLRRLPMAANNYTIGLDQPIFFTNQSRAAKLSDNGTTVVHLIKYVGKAPDDPKSAEKELEQTMEILQPLWQKEVVARQFLPQMTAAFTQPIPGRSGPGPAVPQIKGLYVAGDWAGHGEMLADAAMSSAKRAAQAIIQAKV